MAEETKKGPNVKQDLPETEVEARWVCRWVQRRVEDHMTHLTKRNKINLAQSTTGLKPMCIINRI
jgi:hypothetical protein